jgi:hypothetical protein
VRLAFLLPCVLRLASGGSQAAHQRVVTHNPIPKPHYIRPLPHHHPAALREMNLKYIGSRPVKLRKSDWKDRDLKEVKKKEKEKDKFLAKLGLK